jgi:Zn-dependent protease with chaperone function
MNFFEAQDRARRNTVRLVVLFTLAVIGMIALVNLLVLWVMAYNQTGHVPTTVGALLKPFQWGTFLMVAILVGLLVLGGSTYKILMLAGGGRVIAEALGGSIILRSSTDPMHRKILNVVEEMAIASALPLPTVYMLKESGINAFAAGWTPSDAVIGITRGAVKHLSRDELQGVIAHEFSHILSGDMRLNVRLTGVLHGILILGITGYYLMRSLRYARSTGRSTRGGSAIVALFALGLGLFVIGYVGTFFGSWIKAMVGRQREYFADASAVRFTRNQEGIAGALKKIGGLSAVSRLRSPAAAEFSHAYFAKGVSSFMESLFPTHPPLDQRIRRIDPRWDGKFAGLKPETSTYVLDEPAAGPEGGERAGRAVATGLSVAMADAVDAIDQIGRPSDAQVGYARELLTKIPDALKAETQDPYGVRAVTYAMVMHPDPAVQKIQWGLLEQRADKGLYRKTQELTPIAATLDRQLRLPLIDLSLPALRELTMRQYKEFRDTLMALMAADKKIDFGEWVIQRVLLRRADEAHGLQKSPTAKYGILGDVKAECELLLSLVAHTEHGEDSVAAARAFDAGRKAIGATAFTMLPRKEVSLRRLDEAVDRIGQLKPLLKPRVLKACAACIAADGRVTVAGMELLRAVASTLHCPMPPVIKRSAEHIQGETIGRAIGGAPMT